MKREVIQLCGAISNLTMREVYENFNKAEMIIRHKYPDVVIINPVRLCDHITEAYVEAGWTPPWGGITWMFVKDL